MLQLRHARIVTTDIRKAVWTKPPLRPGETPKMQPFLTWIAGSAGTRTLSTELWSFCNHSKAAWSAARRTGSTQCASAVCRR